MNKGVHMLPQDKKSRNTSNKKITSEMMGDLLSLTPFLLSVGSQFLELPYELCANLDGKTVEKRDGKFKSFHATYLSFAGNGVLQTEYDAAKKQCVFTEKILKKYNIKCIKYFAGENKEYPASYDVHLIIPTQTLDKNDVFFNALKRAFADSVLSMNVQRFYNLIQSKQK